MIKSVRCAILTWRDKVGLSEPGLKFWAVSERKGVPAAADGLLEPQERPGRREEAQVSALPPRSRARIQDTPRGKCVT